MVDTSPAPYTFTYTADGSAEPEDFLQRLALAPAAVAAQFKVVVREELPLRLGATFTAIKAGDHGRHYGTQVALKTLNAAIAEYATRCGKYVFVYHGTDAADAAVCAAIRDAQPPIAAQFATAVTAATGVPCTLYARGDVVSVLGCGEQAREQVMRLLAAKTAALFPAPQNVGGGNNFGFSYYLGDAAATACAARLRLLPGNNISTHGSPCYATFALPGVAYKWYGSVAIAKANAYATEEGVTPPDAAAESLDTVTFAVNAVDAVPVDPATAADVAPVYGATVHVVPVDPATAADVAPVYAATVHVVPVDPATVHVVPVDPATVHVVPVDPATAADVALVGVVPDGVPAAKAVPADVVVDDVPAVAAAIPAAFIRAAQRTAVRTTYVMYVRAQEEAAFLARLRRVRPEWRECVSVLLIDDTTVMYSGDCMRKDGDRSFSKEDVLRLLLWTE
jgi:hypothetical protein